MSPYQFASRVVLIGVLVSGCVFGCISLDAANAPRPVNIKKTKTLDEVKSVFPEMEPPLIELDPKPSIVWVYTIITNGVKVTEMSSKQEGPMEKDETKWTTHLVWKDANSLTHKLWANDNTMCYRRQVILKSEDKPPYVQLP